VTIGYINRETAEAASGKFRFAIDILQLEEPAVHTILFYDVVEDYERRRTMFREEHLTLARESYARGEMVLAGALADPADGAVLVFRGDSPEVAVAFAKADPYVRNGLVTAWRVRKWNTVIGSQ
jgi:hypothetical protein